MIYDRFLSMVNIRSPIAICDMEDVVDCDGMIGYKAYRLNEEEDVIKLIKLMNDLVDDNKKVSCENDELRSNMLHLKQKYLNVVNEHLDLLKRNPTVHIPTVVILDSIIEELSE